MDPDKINVAIRARPLNQREINGGQRSEWAIEGNSICLASQDNRAPTSTYYFDKIFSEEADTSKIYDVVAKNIILSTMNGVNGTIFAYGQTSSGKTFTMHGCKEEPGIIPMAIQDIFRYILETPDREFLLRVSYLEIYNEVIKDLLNPENQNLKIHEDPTRGVFVGKLTEAIVLSPEEVIQLMKKGESNRHVGETNMNERSSRSHTIFRMIIESRERSKESKRDSQTNVGGAVKVSSLNLVDLAGSERVGQTGAEGIRLREGGHINKSLLALGTVIAKLADQDSDRGHIPYRDSKLTRILQPSLGGNARTAIICAITTASSFYEETISTLKFASRAKTISNKPEVNEVLTDEVLLKRYRKQINSLKKQLDEVKNQKEDDETKTQTPDKRLRTMLKEKEEEKTRLLSHYENLKKMILTSTHMNSSANIKAAQKVRRRTWFPGFNNDRAEIGDLDTDTNGNFDVKRKAERVSIVHQETSTEILDKVTHEMTKIKKEKDSFSVRVNSLMDDRQKIVSAIEELIESDVSEQQLEALPQELKSLGDYLNNLKSSLEYNKCIIQKNAEMYSETERFLQMETKSIQTAYQEKVDEYEKTKQSLQAIIDETQNHMQDYEMKQKKIVEERDAEIQTARKSLADLEIKYNDILETKEKELLTAETEIQNLTEAKAVLEEQVEEINAEADELVLQFNTQLKEKQEEIENAVQKLNELQDEFEQELQNHQTEVQDYQAQLESIAEEHVQIVQNSQEELNKIKIELEQLQEVKANLETSKEEELSLLKEAMANQEEKAKEEIQQITESRDAAKGDLDMVKSQLAEMESVHEEKSKELESTIRRLSEEHDSVISQKESLQKEMSKVQSEYESLCAEHSSSKEMIEKLEQESSEMTAAHSSLQKSYEEVDDQRQSLVDRNTELLSKLVQLEERLVASEKAAGELHEDLARLRTLKVEFNSKVTEVQELQSLVSNLKDKLESSNSQIDQLNAQGQELLSNFEETKERLSKSEDMISSLEQEKSNLSEQLTESLNVNAELKQAMQGSNSSMFEMQEIVETERRRIKEFEANTKQLGIQLSELQESLDSKELELSDEIEKSNLKYENLQEQSQREIEEIRSNYEQMLEEMKSELNEVRDTTQQTEQQKNDLEIEFKGMLDSAFEEKDLILEQLTKSQEECESLKEKLALCEANFAETENLLADQKAQTQSSIKSLQEVTALKGELHIKIAILKKQHTSIVQEHKEEVQALQNLLEQTLSHFVAFVEQNQSDVDRLEAEKQEAIDNFTQVTKELEEWKDSANNSDDRLANVAKSLECEKERSAHLTNEITNITRELESTKETLKEKDMQIELQCNEAEEALAQAYEESTENIRKLKELHAEQIRELEHSLENDVNAAKNEASDKLKSTQDTYAQKVRELETKLEESTNELNDVQNTLSETDAKYKQLSSKVESGLYTPVQDYQNAVEALHAYETELTKTLEVLKKERAQSEAFKQKYYMISEELDNVKEQMQEHELMISNQTTHDFEIKIKQLEEDHNQTILTLRKQMSETESNLNSSKQLICDQESKLKAMEENHAQDMQSLTTSLEEAQQALNASQLLVSTRDDTIKEIEDKHAQTLLELRDKIAETERDLEITEQMASDQTTGNKELTVELESLQTEIQNLKEQNNLLQQNKSDLESKQQDLTSSIEDLQVQLQSSAGISQEAEDLKKELSIADERLLLAEEEQSTLQDQIKKQNEQIQSLTEELENLDKDLKQQLSNAEDISVLRNRISELEDDVQISRSEISSFKQENELLVEELTHSKEKIDQVTSELSSGEHENAVNLLNSELSDRESELRAIRKELTNYKQETEKQIINLKKENKAIMDSLMEEYEVKEQIWVSEKEKYDATEKQLQLEIDRNQIAFAKENKLKSLKVVELEDRVRELTENLSIGQQKLAELQQSLHQRESEAEFSSKKLLKLETQISKESSEVETSQDTPDGQLDVVRSLNNELDQLRSENEVLRKEYRTIVLVKNNEISKSRQTADSLLQAQMENDKLKRKIDTLMSNTKIEEKKPIEDNPPAKRHTRSSRISNSTSEISSNIVSPKRKAVVDLSVEIETKVDNSTRRTTRTAAKKTRVEALDTSSSELKSSISEESTVTEESKQTKPVRRLRPLRSRRGANKDNDEEAATPECNQQ